MNLSAIFAVGAAGCFATMGAFVKLASAELPLVVVVFLRNGFALMLLAPWLCYAGVSCFATSHFSIHLFRAFVGIASIYCYFYAIPNMQLSNAVLLNYSQPLFIPFIAWFWLRESPSLKIWLTVSIGFLGIALIVKPNSGLITPVAVIGLMAGVLGAVAMVAVRRMAYTEPAIRIVFYFAALGTLISVGPAVAFWDTPDITGWTLMLVAAFLGVCGQIMLTRAYALASASQVGSLEYSAVVFAAIYGWMLWHEVPDINGIVGTGLVVLAAGLVVTFRSP